MKLYVPQLLRLYRQPSLESRVLCPCLYSSARALCRIHPVFSGTAAQEQSPALLDGQTLCLQYSFHQRAGRHGASNLRERPAGPETAFVRTIKRDYARVNPRLDAATIIAQLPDWFHHYNTVQPHKA